MNREERIKSLIEKGYTCNPETGEIFGVNENEINNIMKIGYNQLQVYDKNGKRYMIYAHHFIWYWVNKEIVNLIDHIDENRSNNKISNLRKSNHQKNKMNRSKVKGYYFDKKNNKYKAQIAVSGKTKYLGTYNTPEDAHNAYLEAKEIYHII